MADTQGIYHFVTVRRLLAIFMPYLTFVITRRERKSEILGMGYYMPDGEVGLPQITYAMDRLPRQNVRCKNESDFV
jgi:hypothetical protein